VATILEISDGTTTIALNLAEGVSGFKLGGLEPAWNPTNPFYKGGGTWQQSPLSDGRQLVDKRFENTIDTFSVHVEGTSQDDLITNQQNLKRLLEKAADYWATDYQDVPVYIKAKADNETNSRYAIIYTGRFLQDGNPYACRFNGGVGSTNTIWMWNLTLILEHDHWTENAPGTGTAVEISSVETYDGRNLGNVDSTETRDPTTANEVFVGNKQIVANFTDIYVDDGGVFGANLMDAALPYNLLPAVPAANDAVYFGIDTSIADSGPFSSIIFDIGTAGTGYNGTWEYWTGAAWAALSVTDNTASAQPFDTTGVNAVSFDHPSNWATRNLSLDGGPAITGYWVRMRVTSTPGALISPTQQNRDVYSGILGYVEIQSSQVLGDIQALAEIEFYGQSGTVASEQRMASRVVWGLRSYDRGSNFSAYINCSGTDQNPSGISGNNVVPNSLIATDINSSAGKVIEWIPVGSASDVYIARIELDDTIVPEYYGKYHLFLRARDDTGTATITFYATYNEVNGTEVSASNQLAELEVTPEYGFLDLGVINIPTSNSLKTGNPTIQYNINIYANTSGAASVKLNDIIIIPVDEFSMDCFLDSRPIGGGLFIINDYKLNMDSISAPKYRTITTSEKVSTNIQYLPWVEISPGKVILQANSRQRLWFVTALRRISPDSGGINISTPYNLDSVLVFRQSQYLSMRGSR
jgi:hypothetical protein